MKLTNRNVIVIQRKDRAPIVIGPFNKRLAAVVRCDEIETCLEDEFGLTAGLEYDISVVSCCSVDTNNEDITTMAMTITQLQ